MTEASFYLLAADLILILHTLFVAFVVIGLVLIYAGYWLAWHWVYHFWFRLCHLGAILFVVVSSWLGVACPLTIWEIELRKSANANYYDTTFIQYWLHKVLYYTAPNWVFILVYTLFGSLVVLSWFKIPPTKRITQ